MEIVGGSWRWVEIEDNGWGVAISVEQAWVLGVVDGVERGCWLLVAIVVAPAALFTQLCQQFAHGWRAIVQAVVPPASGSFYERVAGSGVALQVLLHRTVYLGQLGLAEERAVEVVDMLGQQAHTDALAAHVGQYAQYLFLVAHVFWFPIGLASDGSMS